MNKKLILAAAILCSVNQPSVLAEATDVSQSINKAIKSSKITGDYQVNSSYDPVHKESIVMMYAHTQAKDIDYKIDAVLLAHTVMEVLPHAVRFRIQFFDPSRTFYSEVVVTKPEVTAYSSGSVSKSDLLASLELVKHEVSEPRQTYSTLSRRSTASSSPQLRALVALREKGLEFGYPKSWVATPMNTQWGDFVELTKTGKSWCSIIFRLGDKESPERALSEEQAYMLTTQHTLLQPAQSLALGYGRKLRGVEISLSDDKIPTEQRRERHIYFGGPHRVYSISVRYCLDDAAVVKSDLDTILDTIRYL